MDAQVQEQLKGRTQRISTQFPNVSHIRSVLIWAVLEGFIRLSGQVSQIRFAAELEVAWLMIWTCRQFLDPVEWLFGDAPPEMFGSPISFHGWVVRCLYWLFEIRGAANPSNMAASAWVAHVGCRQCLKVDVVCDTQVDAPFCHVAKHSLWLPPSPVRSFWNDILEGTEHLLLHATWCPIPILEALSNPKASSRPCARRRRARQGLALDGLGVGKTRKTCSSKYRHWRWGG